METKPSVVIALGGEPASGKTTLLKRIRKNFPNLTPFKNGLVRGEYCPHNKVYFVGVFDDTMFEGTDKLSLSVQPSFIEFVNSTPDAKIVYEGDRLFNASLFEQLKSVIFILELSPSIHKARHSQRGHEQNETFLKGRKTKIENTKNSFNHTILHNDYEKDIEINETEIMKVLLMAHIPDALIAKKITKQEPVIQQALF
jgi:GTPase SAR1 family protein